MFISGNSQSKWTRVWICEDNGDTSEKSEIILSVTNGQRVPSKDNGFLIEWSNRFLGRVFGGHLDWSSHPFQRVSSNRGLIATVSGHVLHFQSIIFPSTANL